MVIRLTSSSLWKVAEAAPFEATALLVAPLATALGVLEGSKEEQAKRLLASVFNAARHRFRQGNRGILADFLDFSMKIMDF